MVNDDCSACFIWVSGCPGFVLLVFVVLRFGFCALLVVRLLVGFALLGSLFDCLL